LKHHPGLGRPTNSLLRFQPLWYFFGAFSAGPVHPFFDASLMPNLPTRKVGIYVGPCTGTGFNRLKGIGPSFMTSRFKSSHPPNRLFFFILWVLFSAVFIQIPAAPITNAPSVVVGPGAAFHQFSHQLFKAPPFLALGDSFAWTGASLAFEPDPLNRLLLVQAFDV